MMNRLEVRILLLISAIIVSPAGSQFTKPEKCGSETGCFHDCKEDGTGCTFLVAWANKTGAVEFNITTKTASVHHEYFSIGFSDDTRMGNDSVTECVVENSTAPTIGIYHSYNLASGIEDNNRLEKELANEGLEDRHYVSDDASITCGFKQAESVADSNKIFDLKSDWILFFARGRMDPNNPVKKLRHNEEHPPTTKIAVDFQSTQDIRYSTEEDDTPAGVVKPDGCGTTLGCFHDGTDVTDNTFVVTWESVSNHTTEFHIYASAPDTTKRWFAIGFSDDRKMKSDSVVECVMEDDEHIDVYHSYNEDDEDDNERLPHEDAKKGLRFANAYHKDGVFMCEFYRENKPVDAPKEIFDLNENWYLFFATGLMKGDKKLVHSLDPEPWTSEHRVDFQMYVNIVASEEEGSFVKKLHGIIMVLAWVTCASVGLVIARYYKPMYPEKKIYGTDVWFQVHRTLMVVCVVLMIISFILIFIEEGEWVEIHGSAFEKGHPICGLLVFILAIINPIMSVFRGAPDGDNRKYFHWGHLGVGISAHALAALTILMGVNLDEAHVTSTATYIVILYVIYQIAFELFLEFRHKIFSDKSEEYQVQGVDGNSTVTESQDAKQESQVEKITRLALYVHIGVIAVLSFLIVILVAIPP